MGLDMWIEKCYKGTNDWSDAIYWRKANHIRRFLTENGKERKGSWSLDRAVLFELYNRCMAVLDEAVHVSGDEDGNLYVDDWQAAEHQPPAFAQVAAEKLPTQTGFFFGSQDYGAHYLSGICETLNWLYPVLTNWDAKRKVHDNSGYRYRYSESW